MAIEETPGWRPKPGKPPATPIVSPVILSVEYEPGKKTWVALIAGKCKKYGLQREFQPANNKQPKQAGTAEYIVEAGGLYEVSEKDARSFVVIAAEGPVALTTIQLAEHLEAMEVAKRAKKRREADKRRERKEKNLADIDAQILRINNEGGIINPSEN